MQHGIDISDDDWDSFEAAARSVHPESLNPRDEVIREFINWYMRYPKADLPSRPHVCGSPNYRDRCELSFGHNVRCQEGIMSWPKGAVRPVSPRRG